MVLFGVNLSTSTRLIYHGARSCCRRWAAAPMPCPACTSAMIRAALAAIVPIRLVAPVVGVPVKEVGAGRRPLVRARFGVRWRVRIGATVEVGVGRRARVGATVELGAGRRARIRTRIKLGSEGRTARFCCTIAIAAATATTITRIYALSIGSRARTRNSVPVTRSPCRHQARPPRLGGRRRSLMNEPDNTSRIIRLANKRNAMW